VTTTGVVDVDGLPVHVLEAGDGPPVLLLHGSGPGTTGPGAWRATVEALAGSWRLVAPDQPGFGRTPLPPGSTGGLRDWTRVATGLMDRLGHTTYAVVGHSMGGAVALALAAAEPERVSRVVAVATMGAPGAPLSEDLDAVWAAPPGTAGARDMLERLLLDRSLVTDRAVEDRSHAMLDGASAYARMFPPPRVRWAEDLTLSPATLGAVRAPVLLLHGAQDTLTPVSTAALPLLEHLADVRLHVFGRCGHVPPLERSEEFLADLAAFLA
jgi:pimeloyl-ACP methyl ester carboxylesterase